MERIIKKINYWMIIFIIIMMPSAFFLNNYIYEILDIKFSLYFYQVLHFIIPFEIFIYIYNLVKRNSKFSKYDIFIYALIFLGIVSTINAVDAQTSFWGAYLRNEGLLALISYYLLFLNSKSLNKEEMNKVINWMFIVGIIQFIYSCLQVFVRGDYVVRGPSYMAIGFIGSHNMLGSFCLLLLGISLMMYLVYDNKKHLILSIMFFINLILTQSTGPFFSFVLLFVFIIILLIIKKVINWKKILCLLLMFIATFLVVSFGSEKYCKEVFNDPIIPLNTIKGDIKNTLSIFSIFGSNVDKTTEKEEMFQNYGSGRLVIWKNTMKIVPKYFWTGAGIDNFGYVYPKQNAYAYVDKAHNEYLQILVTEGIFTLITYLGLLLCLFIDGIRSNNKLIWILLVGFVGYAMQALMNISVTTVGPFYFIVIGMLAGLINNEKSKEKV